MLRVTVDRTVQFDSQATILHLTVTATAGEDPYVFVLDLSEGREFVRVASISDIIYILSENEPTPSPTPTPTAFATPTPTPEPPYYIRTDRLTLYFGSSDVTTDALEAILDDVKFCGQAQEIGEGAEEIFTATFHETLPVAPSTAARVREYLTAKEIAPVFRRRDPSYTTNKLTPHKRNNQDHLKSPVTDNPLTRGTKL